MTDDQNMRNSNESNDPTIQSQDLTNLPERTESTANMPEKTVSTTYELQSKESTAIMDRNNPEDNTQAPEDDQKIVGGTGEDSNQQFSLGWMIKHIRADTEAKFIRATHGSLEPDELAQALVARFGTEPATARQLVVDELDRINIERETAAEHNYSTEQDLQEEIYKRSLARHDARVERASARFEEIKELPSSIRKTGASVSAEQGQKMYQH